MNRSINARATLIGESPAILCDCHECGRVCTVWKITEIALFSTVFGGAFRLDERIKTGTQQKKVFLGFFPRRAQ